jgi:predicted deacylase
MWLAAGVELTCLVAEVIILFVFILPGLNRKQENVPPSAQNPTSEQTISGTDTSPFSTGTVSSSPMDTPTVLLPPTSQPIRNVFSIGRSVQGREINVTCLGMGNATLVIAGGIHGDEQNTIILVEDLLSGFSKTTPSSSYTICFLPALNPDGVQKGTRTNADGVDLNRNWNTGNWRSDPEGPSGLLKGGGGSHPFSESETQAYSTFLQNQYQRSPAGFAEIMYHSRYPPDGLVQPGYVKNSSEYTPDAQTSMLARAFASQIGSLYSESFPAYEISGELINWCAEQGISCFDVELKDFTVLTDSMVNVHFKAILEELKLLAP